MIRFFVGLGCGVILTLCSFGFIGIGHGTYVPMALSGCLIAVIADFGPVPPMLLVPFLWAIYFLFIPRIRKTLARISTALIIILLHFISGISLAVDDPAFMGMVNNQRGQMLTFALVFAVSLASLLYLGVRESNKAKL